MCSSGSNSPSSRFSRMRDPGSRNACRSPSMLTSCILIQEVATRSSSWSGSTTSFAFTAAMESPCSGACARQ